MKIRGEYVLREVAGKMVALPMNGDIDLDTMITMNETGAFLWEKLLNDVTEDELVASLLQEYDVDEITARRSVQGFVERLRKNGFID